MPRREQRDIFPVLQQIIVLPGDDHVVAEYQEIERDPAGPEKRREAKPPLRVDQEFTAPQAAALRALIARVRAILDARYV